MKKIVGYKAFNSNLKSFDFKFEVGKTHIFKGKVDVGLSGFHFCVNPIEVRQYYKPSAHNRFFLIEASGEIQQDGDRYACSKIKLIKELSPIEVDREINDFLCCITKRRMISNKINARTTSSLDLDRSSSNNHGNSSVSSNTGEYSSASNTGDRSSSTNTGCKSSSSNMGFCSSSTNTGYASSSSNMGLFAVSSNTGDESCSSNSGNRSISSNTGRCGISINTGESGIAVSTGDGSHTLVGDRSIAINSGHEGSVSGKLGSILILVKPDDKLVKTLIVGKKGIKADTKYRLEGKKVVVAN